MQEPSKVRLTFPVPVPMDAGCVIEIVFPAEMGLSTLNLVEGLGIFGSKRVLTGQTLGNTY